MSLEAIKDKFIQIRWANIDFFSFFYPIGKPAL
jgi:hypothetical protein